MSNFDQGIVDDDFPHLADSLIEHHQVVTIGLPEEEPVNPHGTPGPKVAESIDDWL